VGFGRHAETMPAVIYEQLELAAGEKLRDKGRPAIRHALGRTARPRGVMEDVTGHFRTFRSMAGRAVAVAGG